MQAVSGIETIVVDGGSSDGSPEEAGKHPVTVVRTARGRAGQMNAGAAAAAGEVLLFLHVDTVLPSDFPLLLEHVVHDGQAVGGAFTFAVDGRGAFYRFIERTANFRSRYMRVVFGDQAIFATSTAFRSAGGYPDQPVMEDCAFADRLRRQGNFIILPQKAVTSARRWEEAGPLWNTLVNVVITWAYRLGVSPERLKKWHKRAMRVQW